MKKIMIALLCAGLLLSGCGEQETADTPSVNSDTYPSVSVSPALEPVAQYLTQAVLDCSAHEALRHIQASDSTEQAYQALLDGSAELLIAYEADLGEEVEWTELGTDALVFAADPNCGADNLSVQQLKDIYAGTVTNWKQVGGKDMEIVIRHRAKGSASRSALERAMTVNAAEGAPDERSGCLYYMTYSEYQCTAEGSLKLLTVDGVQPEANTSEYAFPMPYGAALRKSAEQNSEERIVFRWLAAEYSSANFPNSDVQR